MLQGFAVIAAEIRESGYVSIVRLYTYIDFFAFGYINAIIITFDVVPKLVAFLK
jgi:hypothetical protein